MAEVALRSVALSRSFGGLAAVASVSLECHCGTVHAVVGRDGAGKTTLINMLSGDLAPSSGRVELFGEDVTGLPPERMSRRGVGRSYQKTSIFPGFSAFENCRLAAQARLPGSMRFLRRVERYHEVNAAAARALAAAGLGQRSDLRASALSHGEQRRLEIAMLLATAPRVLLLDEPLAGMGAEESGRMLGLIRALRD
ncbi:MAG: ATP-binding cassette domain-containing protein, partial [Burkholderiales bacterium]